LTHAPEIKLPAAMMSYVYRLRWQVGLIFRQVKSVLRLDKMESDVPHRVQSEMGARLICAVLLFSWPTQVSAECWQRQAGEASFEKLIRMMQHWGHALARACLGGPERLLQELRILWKHLLVNARKGRQNPGPLPGKIFSTSGSAPWPPQAKPKDLSPGKKTSTPSLI
jgi:hypothetical protein